MKNKFKRPKSVEEYNSILNYLKENGLVIGNLYQELEMSSGPVSFHRDTSFKIQNISLHSHSFYEILLCRSSDRVEYLVGRERYKLSGGDLLIVAPGVSHRPIMPKDMTVPYERDILWVREEIVDRVKEQFSLTERPQFELMNVKGTVWSYIAELFDGGIKESESEATGYLEATLAFASLILTHIYRALTSGNAQNFGALKPTLVTSIIEYIEENIDKKLTIELIAQHFYVSRSTVIKLFRETMYTSLHDFVTQRRLILAKQLISKGEAMETVAIKCGFSDYSVFYKAFKKEYGLSPREFARLG